MTGYDEETVVEAFERAHPEAMARARDELLAAYRVEHGGRDPVPRKRPATRTAAQAAPTTHDEPQEGNAP